MALGMFYLAIILVVTNMNQSSSSDTSERDVHRLSSGVKFTWIQNILPQSQQWRHSFILNLPYNLLADSHRELLVYKNVTKRTRWVEDCLEAYDIQLHGKLHANDLQTPESNPRNYCIQFALFFKGIVKIVKDNHDL